MSDIEVAKQVPLKLRDYAASVKKYKSQVRALHNEASDGWRSAMVPQVNELFEEVTYLCDSVNKRLVDVASDIDVVIDEEMM